MSPENKARGIRLTGEKGRVYRQLRREFGVPSLPNDALRPIRESDSGLDFLESWHYFLKNRQSLMEQHNGSYVAISGGEIIATGRNEVQLGLRLRQFEGDPKRLIFQARVAPADLTPPKTRVYRMHS